MKKVINNDAIEAIKKRYDTPLHQGIFLSLAGILRTKEKNKISEFALSKKDLGADLAAAPNIIISLCNYCSYKDEEAKKAKLALKEFKAVTKDAEKRLLKRVANAGSE